MLFCWGKGFYGQLGLGEERAAEAVPFCRGPPAVLGQEVVLVACGERHTLLLLADGSLASCGDNAQGQLGRRLPGGQQRCYVPGKKRGFDTSEGHLLGGWEQSQPGCWVSLGGRWATVGTECWTRWTKSPIQQGQIQALETQTVVYISCGKEHSLAICNRGQVFSWGAGGFGQLGSGDQRDHRTPLKINALSMYNVIQVACGHYHSIALTKDGRVFSWGQNLHGQLGLGKRFSSQESPCPISSLAGIPLAQVVAGGAHSFALSLSGDVYGWGKNKAHQLGLSQRPPKDQIFRPCSIAALRNLEVAFISCGDEHTAVLTKSGSVFTFGDDSAGQLGRSSSTPDTGPQKVDGIDGPVSRVSCGSYHTLCISASGKLQSFGSGPLQRKEKTTFDKGQDERKCINISALVSPNDLLGVEVQHIVAGTYINFVVTIQPSASANTTASLVVLPRISQLDRGLIEKWKSADIGSREIALREIEAIFSSPSCLTGSFLKPRSALESSNGIPVDLPEAREVLEELTMKYWIAREIHSSLLNHLIPALPRGSSHQEAVAVFLLLPECSAALEAQVMPSLALPFAEAVNSLNKSASGILENYWTMLPDSYLEQIVQMLKKAVSNMLPFYFSVPKAQKWLPPLKVLKKLYKINMKASCKLQPSTFCIEELTEINSLFHDLWRWQLWIESSNVEEDESAISFCRFPFLYDVLAKKFILELHSVVMQEFATREDLREWVQCQHPRTASELPPLPFFRLKVQRHNLAEDTWCKLSQVEDSCLKKQLVIQFENEMNNYEASGILLEFFSLVFEEIVQPDYGMFMYYEDDSPLWFPPKLSVEKNKYFLFGILFGLSIANRITAYIPLPLVVFKKLLGRPPSLSDVKELSRGLWNSLQTVLNYEKEDFEDALGLCYSISWGNMDVDLIPNGILKDVNNTNKKDYVSKYVDYIFNKSVNAVFKEFERGFYKVLDKRIIGFFEPEQLMEVAIGNANYDWDVYEENAEYSNIYNATHSTIRTFWEVFHKLSLEDKKGFLVFVAGSDRIPVTGMKSMKIKICPHHLASDDFIPESRTCHHLLLLPVYSSKEKLKEKLLCAIKNNRGFYGIQ